MQQWGMNMVILLLLSLCLFAQGEDVYEMQYKPRKDSLTNLKTRIDIPSSKRLGKFTWSNCNKTAVPISFSALSISPEPVQFGKIAYISCSMNVAEDVGKTSTFNIDAKITLDVQGTPIDVCSYQPSYCHFENVCSVIPSACSDFIRKISPDCKCPLKKNTYNVKNASYKIPSVPVSIDGTLHATVHVTENSKEIGCVDLSFCIGSC